MKLVLPLVQFLLLVLSIAKGQDETESKPKMRNVCYYTDWSVYRDEQWRFKPQTINPYLCTHVIYSFAKVLVDEADIAPGDPYQDIEKNGFKDFVDLRDKFNDDLKCLLAIGGYREGSTQFSPISASAEKRTQFAKNALQFLKTHSFDGLNIDWQFPNDRARNGLPEDVANFVSLLQDIDKVFREEAAASAEPKKLLTISVPGNTLIVENGYDLPNLQKYVEFMNVLCYDYHFAFDPDVAHHSPLYPLPEEVAGSQHENEGLNADSTVNFIISKGVDPFKLNLGVPLYGRTFTLEEEETNELGSPATGQGSKGKATREDGYIAYYEVCNNIKDGWKVVHHNRTAMGPYAYKGDQWVGYDDEESVRRKGEYAKQKGLGGLSFWSIDQDDFLGSCGTRAYPLIKAGREGFLKAKREVVSSSTTTTRQPKTTRTTTTTPRTTKTPSPKVKPLSRSVTPPRATSTTEKPAQPPQTLQTIYQTVIYLPVVYLPVICFFNPRHWTRPTKDYDDSEVIDAAPETEAPPAKFIPSRIDSAYNAPAAVPAPPNRNGGTGGLIQNIYVWITNNIFNHSPPQYVDTSVQSQKHKPLGKPQMIAGQNDRQRAKWSGTVDMATIMDNREDIEYKSGHPVWS